MASQLNHKGLNTKATKDTGLEAGTQGQTRVDMVSAVPAIKRITAAKKTDSEAKVKAESESEESEGDEKGEEGEETTNAKKVAPTFHTFLSKLPREIGAMIIELAAITEPAIAYGHCRLKIGATMAPVVATGAKGSLSKFKKLVCLGKLLPDFKCNIERGSGVPLSDALAKDPRLGIRKDMDLMVFLFEKNDLEQFNWDSRSQRSTNRAKLAPGILNVGVHYDLTDGKGLACNFCAYRICSLCPASLCPRQLAIFAQNLGDVHNIFILARLKSADVVGTSRSKHMNLMKTLIADTKHLPQHVSFKDSDRTWVEVSKMSPSGTKDLIDSNVLGCALRLSQKAFRVNNRQIAAIVGRNARRNIRFRVLLGSYWKDATLGL
ncbi:hypothetical protein CH063_09281 [Colletotrichum higginsianum]|uniref:Uncharacterized protein n=2 Tax=Colletotrichum higginsianum TaxID=80884 RepID=H1VD06_COLHI|nr:hypothetical protein CH63R_12124 [Colletotrichum higginsianum IMI 349063]OBR05421.1 hypothetical protein CH63R_12124 [Colletotrichum higginsianum IMI 349063]TIC93936.1 hypothetical protein CH35J_009787 [Colletotrichum higginsianum]CCF38109.1 hypothetical protein CH063_09281 [Colletotrichum higginsianum]